MFDMWTPNNPRQLMANLIYNTVAKALLFFSCMASLSIKIITAYDQTHEID